MTNHFIHRQLEAESLFVKVWEQYASVMPQLLTISKPAFRCVSKANRYAGMYYHRGIVEINLAFDFPAGQLEETIAHEIAHHITRKLYPNAAQAHGPEFRYVMSQIGYKGDTYHTMDVSAAKQKAKDDKDDVFPLF